MHKLSLIIPVYNVEQYIARCFESVHNQEIDNLQIIFVDDGSPDNCPSILDKYAASDSRIKIVHKKNGGLASAVKEGTLISDGEYIAYLDSDDWLRDNWGKEINTVLQNHSPDVICFEYARVTGKKETYSENQYEERMYSKSEISFTSVYMRKKGIGATRWNKIYKRSIALKALEHYDIRISMAEDECFTAVALSEATSFYFINRPLINYFINPESMTNKYNEKYYLSYCYLYEALEKYGIGSDLLGYINYINFKSLMNAVYKSDMNDKYGYIKDTLLIEENLNRLKNVNKSSLSRLDRLFLKSMVNKRIQVLFFMTSIYFLLKRVFK